MKKILSLLFLTSSMFSMQLDLVNTDTRAQRFQEKLYKQDFLKTHDLHKVEASVIVPERLGSAKLYHGDKGFYVHHDNKMKRIQKCFTDKMVRNITPEQLQAFAQVGYFTLNKMSDDEYSLRANGRVNGGGPLFGGFMYWATKSVCYGALAAAGSAAVIGTGGAIVGAVAGTAALGGAGTAGALALAGTATSSTVVGIAASTTIATSIVTTAGVGIGTLATAGAVTTGAGGVATVLGASAGGAVVTKAAMVGTGAVLASGVKAGAIIGGIEWLSVTVGTVCGMAPTL